MDVVKISLGYRILKDGDNRKRKKNSKARDGRYVLGFHQLIITCGVLCVF